MLDRLVQKSLVDRRRFNSSAFDRISHALAIRLDQVNCVPKFDAAGSLNNQILLVRGSANFNWLNASLERKMKPAASRFWPVNAISGGPAVPQNRPRAS